MTEVTQQAHTLVVRHVSGTDPASFEIVRLEDGKRAGEVSIPSPYAQAVEGRPGSNLMTELQWYLETFLDYPFEPETEHAERVLAALRAWGESAFNAVFDNRAVGRMFEAAAAEDYGRLRLRVAADDPGILSWPWEALRDPELGLIGCNCQVERAVEQDVRDPAPLPDTLPKDAVHILLVIARPFEDDVAYRSVGRPLIELIEKRHLPARVTVLRPPTLRALCEHLHEHQGAYHIVHFDGHGSYFDSLLLEPGDGSISSGAAPKPYVYAPAGHLHFELENDAETLTEAERIRKTGVTAEQLGAALREGGVPTVVLNACRSGMLHGDAQDPFASVAASLLQAGVRNVVAMAYNLYVSAAQQFLPAFYARLFEEGDVAVAVRAGRQELFADPERMCARGTFPLQDWLVPVLYQQEPFSFDFAVGAAAPEKQKLALGEELDTARNPYGFIGRDGPVLELERALRRDPPAILIQGFGGVGKTTLARGFCRWLGDTEGLGQGCIWIGFQGVRSAEYVINRLGEPLLGDQFTAAPMEQRVAALTEVLHENRFILVWDNFEVVAGIEGTSIKPSLSAEDRQVLSRLLDGLRGGKTKVLITSRSTEDWLGPQRRYLLRLGGMEGEERWAFFTAVLRDLGRSVDRSDPDQVELMKLLGGHPLAMRVILPRLDQQSARELITAIRQNAAAFAGNEAAQEQLFAALRIPLDALPAALRTLQTPLAFHEGYADADYLEYMAKQVKGAPGRGGIDGFVAALATAGLVREMGQGILELHPVLTGLLRGTWLPSVTPGEREAWTRAFVDVMGRLADAYGPKALHEQRVTFHLHGANFHLALQEAERLKTEMHARALTQALASFAQHTRDFTEAQRLYQRFAELCADGGDRDGEATAYHQLGRIAQERRNFAAAEQWHDKSLAITEKLGNEQDAASTYHQLGRIAQERRNFAAAEQWYDKSLAITEKLGNEQDAASTYHQLGMVAQERRDFAAAERWYDKSLAAKERFGNEQDAASTYHQLGMVAQERRDFAAAERWYDKSLAITEKLGNELGAASTYHQLGMVAELGRDFAAAEQWYHKSLAIWEKLGSEQDAAITYHQLGMVAQERHDFAAAERWYLKALSVFERLRMEHQAASTCGQLCSLASSQGQFEGAASWSIRCSRMLAVCKDPDGMAHAAHDFSITLQLAPADLRPKLVAMWEQAGLGAAPRETKDAEQRD